MGDENIQHALDHVSVVHRKDDYLFNALRLELFVLLDVRGRLRAARGRKRPRHSNLGEQVRVSAIYQRKSRRTMMFLPVSSSANGFPGSFSLTCTSSGSLSPGLA